MLKADAVSAHARMKADSEVSSQSDLRSQFMAEAEAANARMKERMEARLLAAQEANRGKLVKLEGMPVMPQPLSGETMLTPVQLERYKVAIKTYINPYDSFVAQWASSLIDDYKEDPTAYLDALPSEQKGLDARLGARLYDKSPVCIQDMLIDDAKRQHDGKE